MTEDSKNFDECLAILKNANRPLSARRLSKMIKSNESMSPQAIETFLRGLEHVDELRKGIFRFGTAHASHTFNETAPDTQKVDSVEIVDRFRDTASRSAVGDDFPETVERAVALRRRFGDRNTLRRHLYRKLISQAVGDGLDETDSDPEFDDDALSPQPLMRLSRSTISRPAKERFIERRLDYQEVGDGERRTVKLNANLEMTPQGQQIMRTLSHDKVPKSFESLLSAMDDVDVGLSAAALRIAVFVENERCRHKGMREPFYLTENGEVGLSIWSVSDRFIVLEQALHEACEEQKEIVKRRLLENLVALDPSSFCHAMVLVLERNGIKVSRRRVSANRWSGMLAGSQLVAGAHRDVNIVLSQSWTQVRAKHIESLVEELSLESGSSLLVITVGNFDASAVRLASQKNALTVQLVDGVELANLFFSSRVGLKVVNWTSYYPDATFFSGLFKS